MTKLFPVSAVIFLFPILLWAAPTDPVRILFDPATRRPVRYSALQNDTRRVMIPVWYRVKPGEMRGVWIATVSNLDFPKSVTPAQFQRTYTDLMFKLKRAGFNAVFFQIRPSCDAFYNSAIHPTSRFLCGREGYGYLFWRGKHNSFRADGKYGQYTIVFPDRQAVVTVTAESRKEPAVLEAVYDCLVPQF